MILFCICGLLGIASGKTIDNGCWKQSNDSVLVYVSSDYENETAGHGAYRREKTIAFYNYTSPLHLPCSQLSKAVTHLQRKWIHFFYPPTVKSSASGRCAQVSIEDISTVIIEMAGVKKNLQTLIFYTAKYKDPASSLVNRYGEDGSIVGLWMVGERNITESVTLILGRADLFIRNFILLVDEKIGKEIIISAREWNLTLSDWTFYLPIMLSGGSDEGNRQLTRDEWGRWLRAGERVILILPDPKYRTPCDAMIFSDASRRLTLNVVTLRREELEVVGEWEPSLGLVKYMDDLWHFDKFHNKTFRIACIDLDVFHFLKTKGNETFWDGIVIEMLKTMSEELNFKYEIVYSVDSKWGAPEEDGEWNGMIGMVLRNEVDFAFAKFTVSAIRDTVIDFGTPFWYEPTVMVMSKPGEDSLWIYAGPFTPEVWYCFVVITPLCGTLVAALLEWERRLKGRDPRTLIASLSKGLWFTYGAFMQQSWNYNPVTMSLRFLVGFWWFFVIVVMATYTGNLIAVLAVPKSTLPVQTLSDLAEQTEYKYGVVDASALHTLFKSSGADIYRRLYDRSIKDKENRVKNHGDGLRKVKKEDYIYIGEKTGVAAVVYSDCDFSLGRETFNPGAFAFAFPENSKYMPIFNDKINAFTENGMIEKWKRHYYPHDRCSLEAASQAKLPDPASLQDTQGALFILGLGVGIATCFLLGELTFRGVMRYCERRRLSEGMDPGYISQPNRVHIPTLLDTLKVRFLTLGVTSGDGGGQTQICPGSQAEKGNVTQNNTTTTSNMNGHCAKSMPDVTENGFEGHLRDRNRNRMTSLNGALRSKSAESSNSHRTQYNNNYTQANGVVPNGPMQTL